MPKLFTELNVHLPVTSVTFRVKSDHPPKLRLHIARQLFRAIKAELILLREFERVGGEKLTIHPSLPALSESRYVGRCVRMARLRRELTQNALAVKMGVARRSLVRIENGINLPTAKMIWLLERELGLNIENLIQRREMRQNVTRDQGGRGENLKQ